MNIEEYATRYKHFWTNVFENKELKLLLDSRHFKKLIDVGCGDGILLYQLNYLGYLSDFDQVWGLDLSANRLETVKTISDKIKVVQDDAQLLEHVPDGNFDFIISSSVIEHVNDDSEMLRSMYRIAQPGAMVYLETVFKKEYAYYFYRNKRGERVLDPTHEREYTDMADLVSKVEAANFHIVSSGMSFYKFSPLNFLLRLVGSRNKMVLNSPTLTKLQSFTVPIPGYRRWKLIMQKPS